MCSLDKRGNVFILTLTGIGNQHRLNDNVLSSLRSALARIRSEYQSSSSPSALVTNSEGKFFCNGFDLEGARKTLASTTNTTTVSPFASLIGDLLSLPMPTIAAVNGHAAAAGFLIALCHDYIAMRADRGFLYMSELDVGIPLPKYCMELIKAKIGNRRVMRDVTLRAVKMTAEEGAERGIVDLVGKNAMDTLDKAVRLAEELVGRKWNGNAYASIRMGASPELCKAIWTEQDDDNNKDKIVVSKL